MNKLEELRQKKADIAMSSARIFKLIIGEPVPEIPEGENILLTESFEGYMKMHAELSNIKLSDILFAGITVGAGGLEKAMDIPRGSDVLVYQSDWEIATRLCKTLIRIGAREIRLTPIGSLEGIDLRGKCIATTHDHMVINDFEIPSVPILMGKAQYPEDILGKLSKVAKTVVLKAGEIASDLGNPKAMNVVLLGALVKAINVPDVDWHKAIRDNVKKGFEDLNIEAFDAGFNA